MPTKFIGPWEGGLNLLSNRDLSVFLDANELGDATNVTYTPEGFLQPRPGCKMWLSSQFTTDIYQHIVMGGDGLIKLVGQVNVGSEGIYAIVQVTNGDMTWLYKIRDVDDVTLMATYDTYVNFTHLIVHSGFTSDFYVYSTEAPTEATYIYRADHGILLFTNNTDPLKPTVYIAPMDLDTVTKPITGYYSEYKVPPSHSGMIVKDRLFLFNKYSNKMHWGPPGQILDFRTVNEITIIAPGPPPVYEPISVAAPFGEDTAGVEIIEPTTPDDIIRCVEFNNNNFYIFKRNATFMFTYQNSPLTDGYLRKISNEMGAYDSTNYKENIVVINNKGVFRVDGTEFTDLQQKMNFRFEFPLDNTNINPTDIFITNFNDQIMFGFRDTVSDITNYKYHYYVMNSLSGAWSKWDYDYTNAIAAPGSDFVLAQYKSDADIKMLFVDFWQQRIVFMYWKPHLSLYDYHLDSNYVNKASYDYFYFPAVGIKTSASFGDSMLNYKKLYRYFIRFYLSDNPTPFPEYPLWTLSINYNEYKFDAANNPKFNLYPVVSNPNNNFNIASSMEVESAIYKRTYQIALPQQRAKEFVFELKRRYSKIPFDLQLVNRDADRPIKAGYYFLLSGFWFDYENKAGI